MWSTSNNFTNPNLINFPSSTSSNAVIDNGAGPIITVSGNVTAGTITFDSNGPYTLFFPTSGTTTISSSTLSFQSNLTVDAEYGATVEIHSAIIGTGSTLTKTDAGTLELTNSANRFQSAEILQGTLEVTSSGALGGATNIAFAGVGTSATLQAAGDVTLSATQQITVAADTAATFDTNGYTMTLLSPIVGNPSTAIPSVNVIDSSGGPNYGTFEIAASETLDQVTVGSSTFGSGALDVEGTLNLTGGATALDIASSTMLSGNGTINHSTTATTLYYESSAASEFDGRITGPGLLEAEKGTLIVGSSAKRLQRWDERRTQLPKQPHFPRRRHLAVENGPEAGRPRRAGRRARGHRARRNTRPWLPAHDSVDRDAWHAGERLRERDHQRHEYQQRRHGLDDRRRFVCRGDRGFDPAREDRARRA